MLKGGMRDAGSMLKGEVIHSDLTTKGTKDTKGE